MPRKTIRKKSTIAAGKKATPIEKSKRGRKSLSKDKDAFLLFTSYELIREECKFLTRVDRTHFYSNLFLQLLPGVTDKLPAYDIRIGDVVAVCGHGNTPYVVEGITTNEGNLANAKLSLTIMENLPIEELPEVPPPCRAKREPLAEISVIYSSVWHIFNDHVDIDEMALPTRKHDTMKKKKKLYCLEKKEKKELQAMATFISDIQEVDHRTKNKSKSSETVPLTPQIPEIYENTINSQTREFNDTIRQLSTDHKNSIDRMAEMIERQVQAQQLLIEKLMDKLPTK